MKSFALVLALAVTAPAHAGVWDDASRTDDEQAAQDTYDLALRVGDDHVLVANTEGSSIPERRQQLNYAIEAYRRAADAKPTSAEPHFRIAEATYSFYFEDCQASLSLSGTYPPLRGCPDASSFNAPAARIVIEAWNAAESIAPLDPRFSPSTLSSVAPSRTLISQNILFERAILNTKLGTKASLLAARTDYEAILDRTGVESFNTNRQVYNNLAETLMMLGDLDGAIDGYREACRRSSDPSTWYGYAVALDRAGDATIARKIITNLGVKAFEEFSESVNDGDTFFVPHGEKFYYFGLIAESLGDARAAVDNFDRFIQSGAHPMYQARAKEHLQLLTASGTPLRTLPKRGFRE